MTETPPRQRWWLRILSAVAVLGVLASASELVLRVVIPGVVADEVRDQLGVPDEHPVEVTLQGSALIAASQGRVGAIEIQVPQVRVLDDIVATLTLSAKSLPFDPTSGRIEGGSGSVTISAESIDSMIELATQGLVDSGEVVDGRIRVGRTMEIFGQRTSLAVILGLAVEEGDVRITPAAISAAGFNLTADELDGLTDGALDALLSVQHLCIRDQLPRGVTLTGVWFPAGGSVTVNADFAPEILSDPRQQQPGTCAESSS